MSIRIFRTSDEKWDDVYKYYAEAPIEFIDANVHLYMIEDILCMPVAELYDRLPTKELKDALMMITLKADERD